MADIQVANTDADLSGNTVVTEENAYTITGLHTFSRSTNAPFACVSGAAVVTYLDSDKLDGQEGTYYLAAANFTGTLAVNRGGTGAATFTDGGVLLGSGTSAITAMAVLSDGEMIVGDGSGDPVAESGATLRTSIGVGTGDSPQFTAVELGHATDTTLARASAGDVNIEGNIVYRAGGTDVPVSDGGTGASSLTDGGVLLGSGTGAITPMAVLADGEMIVGDGSGDPVAESGATLRTSIGVGTGASPTFTGLTITGTGASALDVGGGLNIGTGNVALVNAAGKITALSSTEVDNLSGAALTSLDAGNISAGTLAVARGGTGATSLTDGGVLLGSGTGAVTAMSVLSDSEMIVGDGSGDPVAESGSTLRASIGCDSATNLTSGTLANARLPSNVDLGGTLDVTGATTLDSAARLVAGTTFGSDTAAANTLDDYEEGTWTGSAVSVGGTSLSVVNEVYTKVGNKVWFSGALDANSLTTTGGSSYVSGLPFTVANANPSGSAMKGDYTQAGSVNTPVSTDRVYLSTFSSISGQIRFSGVYTV